MKNLSKMAALISLLVLIGCSPVKIPVANQYQLSAYSGKQVSKSPHQVAIWVTAPEAAAGYQTNQMLYINKPFELAPFVKNSWVNPPAEMIQPLMVQSLQRSGLFHAVISSAYSQGADYRIDTQLLSLEQNFLHKPSVMQLSVKIVLTRVSDNKVLGSRIISQQVPCTADTPYGGVIAANTAARQFTATMTDFVISRIVSHSKRL